MVGMNNTIAKNPQARPDGRRSWRRWILILALALAMLGSGAAAIADGGSPYRQLGRPSSDGIGKAYMGREIARVMGIEGARWLERPAREREEEPSKLVAALPVEPDGAIAEIGAGSGYLSARLAQRVPEGQVFAVDVQRGAIALLDALRQERGLDNLVPVLGTQDDPNLPDGQLDWVVMLDAYHEFAYPREMMGAIARSLKPDGRVLLVEYRAEDPFVFIKRHHKMTARQMRREMAAAGFQDLGSIVTLPQQHAIAFGKVSP